MKIETIAASVDGPHAVLLEPTSATIETGKVTVIDGPPGAGHTAFSLLLGGRLLPSSGRILVDGEADGQRLRNEVAVVDVPTVSEPDEVVSLATTMGEELAMAHLPARHYHVRDWLTERHAVQWRRTRMEDVPPDVRLSLLADVAARRPDVHAVVLCCPDRYGVGAQTALGVAHELAERDLAVCLQTDHQHPARGVGSARHPRKGLT